MKTNSTSGFAKIAIRALTLCVAGTSLALAQSASPTGWWTDSKGINHLGQPHASAGVTVPSASPFARCIPFPADEKLKLLPRPFPMQDFSAKPSLAFNRTDGGCIRKPGKPTRPVPALRSAAV